MRNTLRIVGRVVVAAVIGVGALVFVKAVTFRSVQRPVDSTGMPPVDADAVAKRLGEAIRFNTVSLPPPAPVRSEGFRGLRRFFEITYPHVHSTLREEVVAQYSLLYTWQGEDRSLAPLLLLAHLDVVPIDAPKDWTQPPFSGKIADGYLWGRGSLDDKVSAVGILEAVETLLKSGFRPKRTVYIAFGHDEEISGNAGAASLARELGKRGVAPEFILDEGGAITHDIVGGVDKPVAVVGVAEKGYVSLTLTATSSGGHSSMPPAHSAIGEIAAAVERLENDAFPFEIDGITDRMLDTIGPEMSFTGRLALANRWLFGPIVIERLAASPSTAAALHTTAAVTMIRGGVKDNVLPREASATVNFRIAPGESIASVTARVKQVVDDENIKIAALPFGSEPSAISPIDSVGYIAIEKSIRQVEPGTIVTPALMLGATDSRHYAELTRNIYRFLPMDLNAKDLERIHGVDERIAVDNCARVVQFYIQVIRNAD